MFPSHRDDAIESKKNKNDNKLFQSLSYYNQLLIYGCVVSGHVNLSSMSKIKPISIDEFVPQRVEFNITPENAQINLKRSFAMLEDIKRQDLFAWQYEFL
ncbi:hypothetical protein DMUE_2202 [Dictyocoela muelleri]|nr:hypothetical protein DMUE_2202 [Dictyocoela muelleri]